MKLKYEGISMESKKFYEAHLIKQTQNHETENFTPAKGLNFSLQKDNSIPGIHTIIEPNRP